MRHKRAKGAALPEEQGSVARDRVPHEPAPRETIEARAQRLAAYKVPAQITARDTLPHNMLGKVLRRVLRAEITAEVAGS